MKIVNNPTETIRVKPKMFAVPNNLLWGIADQIRIKQAGAVLGQAQLKLGLDFTSRPKVLL